MSKCVKCGNEILTGDIHWEMGLCNNCYNELYKDHKTHISLDKMWLKLAQDFRDENEKLQDKVADLEAKLAECEKENKTLKDIRTLERVVPRNAQLHKLSNRDCYLKGFENAISETIRTFKETYGKEKCKLIEERDKYLMDIVKAGGYEYQIEELKQQLAEKDKEIEYQENMKILAVENQNKNAIEQLEQIINLFEPYENEEKDTILCANNGISFLEFIDNQIKQLKEGK